MSLDLPTRSIGLLQIACVAAGPRTRLYVYTEGLERLRRRQASDG